MGAALHGWTTTKADKGAVHKCLGLLVLTTVIANSMDHA